MRRLLVIPALSTVIVAVVVAGAAGAGASPGSERDVAKTTIGPAPGSTVPGVSVPTVPIATAALPTVPVPTVGVPTTAEATGLSPGSLAIALPMFGLDPTRLRCVDATLPPFTSDDNAALDVLQGCGVGLMPILRGIVDVSQRSNTFLDPSVTTVVLPTVHGADALPEDDAFYLGFMLLLQPEEVSCLATGLTAATTEDDATALSILQRCEVSLGFTLDMLTFALGGEFTDPTATTLPIVTAPVVTTPLLPTVPGAPTTVLSIAPDDPLVDQFQQMLLDQEGITLDDQQAACVLSSINAGEVDANDVSAMLTLMESCGISLTDLVPSGTSALGRLAASAS